MDSKLLIVSAIFLSIAVPASIFAQADIEARVQSYFSDIPVMIRIAKCESGFRQFNADGTVLRGGAGSQTLGVFQFHESSHLSGAQSLGFDIATLDGNLAYARHLYAQEGTAPWASSFSCWNSALSPTSNLSLGMEGSEILALQQKLNHAGFVLSLSGPGSPGNETTRFGTLTRAAVRLFQCTKLSICSGDEFTTGYGLADSRTQSALKDTTPSDSNSAYNLTEIAKLKAQIEMLLKQVAELQLQLALRAA